MNELRERHVRIPEEVAIASFSGTILSTIVNPQLTTVEQPPPGDGACRRRACLGEDTEALSPEPYRGVGCLHQVEGLHGNR